jgi:cytidylate kinase
VLVALDGRSGADKSTLARQVGADLGALVIDGDDFYRGGTDAHWDVLGPAEGEARWGEAEDLYFDLMMPPDAFDLVLDGS